MVYFSKGISSSASQSATQAALTEPAPDDDDDDCEGLAVEVGCEAGQTPAPPNTDGRSVANKGMAA